MKYIKLIFITTLLIGVVACASRQARWEEAELISTVTAYQQFLEQHPKSEFSVKAHERIKEIRWETAKSIDTKDAYEFFLKLYPAGEFSTEERKRIRAIKDIKK